VKHQQFRQEEIQRAFTAIIEDDGTPLENSNVTDHYITQEDEENEDVIQVTPKTTTSIFSRLGNRIASAILKNKGELSTSLESFRLNDDSSHAELKEGNQITSPTNISSIQHVSSNDTKENDDNSAIQRIKNDTIINEQENLLKDLLATPTISSVSMSLSPYDDEFIDGTISKEIGQSPSKLDDIITSFIRELGQLSDLTTVSLSTASQERYEAMENHTWLIICKWQQEFGHMPLIKSTLQKCTWYMNKVGERHESILRNEVIPEYAMKILNNGGILGQFAYDQKQAQHAKLEKTKALLRQSVQESDLFTELDDHSIEETMQTSNTPLQSPHQINANPISSPIASRKKKKKSAKKRKAAERSLRRILNLSSSESEFDDESGDESSQDADSKYRNLIKDLTKSSKTIKVKELNYHDDPLIRRERFTTWTTDLINVLSTCSATSQILVRYPGVIPEITDPTIDRVLKTLLTSVTSGMAKRLVMNASTAVKALTALKRNYGQTTALDTHQQQVKMLNMKQQGRETVSSYLRRIRKQMELSLSVGNTEYTDETAIGNRNLVNIALNGMHSFNRLYMATHAAFQSSFMKDAYSVTFIELEETFFAIDDNQQKMGFSNMHRQDRREQANYIHHSPRNNNNNDKKNYKKGNCNHCGKPGHWAYECRSNPNAKRTSDDHNSKTQNNNNNNFRNNFGNQRNNYQRQNNNNSSGNRYSKPRTNNDDKKSVTFESIHSAHIAGTRDEHAKVLCERVARANHRPNSGIKNDRTSITNKDTRINSTERAMLLDKIDLGDLLMWLMDSGASSHFTNAYDDLIDPIKLAKPITVLLADGSPVKATFVGSAKLIFYSDQRERVVLILDRVLYVPGLTQKLFSIESFTSSGEFDVTYSKKRVTLTLSSEHTVTIPLPHTPITICTLSAILEESFNTTETVNMAQAVQPNDDELIDDVQAQGGIATDIWKPTPRLENKYAKKKSRLNAQDAHYIFGHIGIPALMNASAHEVWDDISLVFGGHDWCDSCQIAVSKRRAMSKIPTPIHQYWPLQCIFMDAIPCPGSLRTFPNPFNCKQFLWVSCAVSKYCDALVLKDYSTEHCIEAIDEWRRTMYKKGFKIVLCLRTDAGSYFTSEEFRKWCHENDIEVTAAGPRHQEQNSFAERSYQTASQTTRKMLVHARLNLSFYFIALKYACKILRVVPPKGLTTEAGRLITTFEMMHNRKPRIARYKPFGCACVFKRYQPMSNNKIITGFKQLQQGSRGIFVGFPDDQAGWLIYTEQKINRSHLLVSMDVVFDTHFISSLQTNNAPFAGALPERKLGTPAFQPQNVTEHTGDLRHTIADSSISHWGNETTYETPHMLGAPVTPDHIDEIENDHDDDEPPDLVEQDDSEDEEDREIEARRDIERQRRSDYFNQEIPEPINQHGMRRSNRLLNNNNVEEAMTIHEVIDEIESVFSTIETAADIQDVPIDPYLPEPRNLADFNRLSPDIQKDWIKAIRKEIKQVIENETFKKGEKLREGDEVIPSMFAFKAKITSKGFLDKLKARCVARGDMQLRPDDPDNLWSPCVFARTFKMFIASATRHKRPIRQLDFIAAFCQGIIKDQRLFLNLPKEYAHLVPEYKEYFERPLCLARSIYGLQISAKVWNEDVTDHLINNDFMKFHQSEVDPSLFIYREGDQFLTMIIYIDDMLYFATNENLEKKFEKVLKNRFNLELQGNAHWFLGTRIYRESDGSYLIDQENYIKNVLKRYCGDDSTQGLPPMKSTPAPVDYVYTTKNRPETDEEKKEIERRYNGISMPSAVSSLLYAALNTRCDILFIVNKLAKSANNPGMKDFEALMHVFGYLRKYSDRAIKFYADPSESPAHKICARHKIETTHIIGFSDSSWHDCPDSGRSTCGYKVFVQGGLIDAQSTLPIPVALSSAEAEYMGACHLGMMVCHLRDLQYDLDYLGSPTHDAEEGTHPNAPTILLIDNQATVRMSKNYKVTNKNRHVARRWHFVRRGNRDKLFSLCWIPAEDQLADDTTKSQASNKSLPHMERTLIQIPDKVRGHKGSTIGNR
jgi:hypothetical protein